MSAFTERMRDRATSLDYAYFTPDSGDKHRLLDTRELLNKAATMIDQMDEALRPFAAGFPNTDRRDYERAQAILTVIKKEK